MKHNQIIDQINRYLKEIIYTPEKAYLNTDKITPPYEKLVAVLNQLLRHIKEYNQYCRELEAGNVDIEPPISPDNTLARPLKSIQGMLQYMTSVMHRIAEGDDQKRMLVVNGISQNFNAMLERLSKQYYIDRVTGLWNTDGFKHMAVPLLKHVREDSTYYIVFLEWKEWKKFTTLHGRDEGQIELQQFSHWVQQILSPKEIGAHLGKGHFIYLMQDNGTNILQGRLQKLTAPWRQLKRNFCCGYYAVTEPAMSIDDMMERAIFASQYITNEEEPYRVFDDTLKLELTMRQLLLRDVAPNRRDTAFFVQYQPQIDCKTNELIGCEAFAQWICCGKPIQADTFVPLLVEYGLIQEWDLYVVQDVCRLLRDCLDRRVPIVPISINISPFSLEQKDMTTAIAGILHQYSIEPSWIVLEVTELHEVTKERVYEAISRLQQEGFRIAINHFGTGSAAVSVLKNIQADIIKIDPVFLKNETPYSRIALEMLLTLAKHLNIETVAEGVETRETLMFLRKFRCTNAQGNYFYHLLDKSALEYLLQENSKKQG